MDLFALLFLAILQGLTEFLPISSSGHLLLVPVITGWEDQGLVFDLAVHLGSLAAVVLYFRQELWRVSCDVIDSVVHRRMSEDARIGWGVLLGTIPVGLAGLTFKPVIETTMRQPELAAWVIALALIGFGLLLGWADWRNRGQRSERQINWTDIAVIGCAQAIALIPGTSRSGITMTAALFMGFSRQAAARFSFLLSIPVTALACGLQISEIALGAIEVNYGELALAAVVSGIAAYACIHWFLKLLKRFGMQPFVAYRVVLGLLILWLVV